MMTKKRGYNGTKTQRPSSNFDSGRSESSHNSANDTRIPNFRSISQSPNATSNYGSEDSSPSVEEPSSNGHTNLTLPGIEYVTGEVTSGNYLDWYGESEQGRRNGQLSNLPRVRQSHMPEPQHSAFRQYALEGKPLANTEYYDLERPFPQSPPNGVCYASTLGARYPVGEPNDRSQDNRERQNRPLTRYPIASWSEEPGRPRPISCIGMSIIDNEGMCYIYDDGTYCPVFVNGEWVNPGYGLTKTGKARKRLRQACKSCNSKKVKCQPGYTKCDHCEKAHLTCE